MELINSETEEGKVFVNKLAAAERQIAAAIRMYFMEEDPLAIHTVASAAMNLYADLLRRRGKDPAVFLLGYGFLRAAKDFIDGRLTEEELSNWGEGALDFLEPLVDFLRNNPDYDIENARVSGPPDYVQKYWKEKRKSYNFLKHADRDHEALLDLANVNNEDVIAQAIGCAAHLNCEMTPEKEVFISAMYAQGKLENPPLEPALIWVMKAHSPGAVMYLARKHICYPRVDDDVSIDFDEVKEKSVRILAERMEQEFGKQDNKDT